MNMTLFLFVISSIFAAVFADDTYIVRERYGDILKNLPPQLCQDYKGQIENNECKCPNSGTFWSSFNASGEVIAAESCYDVLDTSGCYITSDQQQSKVKYVDYIKESFDLYNTQDCQDFSFQIKVTYWTVDGFLSLSNPQSYFNAKHIFSQATQKNVVTIVFYGGSFPSEMSGTLIKLSINACNTNQCFLMKVKGQQKWDPKIATPSPTSVLPSPTDVLPSPTTIISSTPLVVTISYSATTATPTPATRDTLEDSNKNYVKIVAGLSTGIVLLFLILVIISVILYKRCRKVPEKLSETSSYRNDTTLSFSTSRPNSGEGTLSQVRIPAALAFQNKGFLYENMSNKTPITLDSPCSTTSDSYPAAAYLNIIENKDEAKNKNIYKNSVENKANTKRAENVYEIIVEKKPPF